MPRPVTSPRRHRPRRSLGLRALVALAAAALIVVPIGSASAQQPAQIAVDVSLGLATVTWSAVEGATNYHIERTLMNGDEPAGAGVVVGIWSPNRGGDRITPGPLAFADHGFVVGERYRWRVRAVVGGTPGDWSAPVTRDTPDHPGPAAFLSGFELSDGTRWTTHEEEVALLHAIDAASDRVRVETIGTTYEGRPILLAVVGKPAPGTPDQVAAGASVLLGGTVHGTERSGREAALILLRRLAFSDDAWVNEILDSATVLFVPTQNPDGQANSQRGNLSGQDLNRDHVLLRHPEAFGISKVIRDYKPDIIVDSHENPGAGGDLEYLWPRSRAVEETLFTFNQMEFARGHIYSTAASAGLSPSQWGTHRTDNWETLLSNASGLKNTVGLLQEVPWNSPASRPAEGGNGSPENQRRRSYAALWGFGAVLDYHHDNHARIQGLKDGAAAYNAANTGPIYLDGAYPIPVSPPITDPVTAVLEQPVCGYHITAEQYQQRDGSLPGDPAQWTSATVEDRLAAHGVVVDSIGGGIQQVLLAQPLRPLIPFLFDPELDTPVRPLGTPNISMVEAFRLDDDRATVVVSGTDTGVPNRVDAGGCTTNDLIADEQVWTSSTAFVRHVVEVVGAREAAGLLSAREAATVLRSVGVVPRNFRVQLSGVGGGHPTARGGLQLGWGQDGKVCVSRFQLTGLSASSITSVTIRSGVEGQTGPAVIDLQIPPGPLDNCVTGVATSVLQAIQSSPGSYYVSVTTAAYPNGALRGQIG